jgi:glycine dehydrogenase subunit 2
VYFPLVVHEAMLIEPTETETIESLDELSDAFISIAKEAKENPDLVISAPSTTPIRRVDDALAARNLDINYFAAKK